MLRTFSRRQTAKWWASLDKRASSAGILCETADGRLLIVKANYKKHWSIPGGIIDHNETPKQAAIRETKEEVGISLHPERVKFISVIDRVSEELGHTYQFVFHAMVTEEELLGVVLQEKEIEDYALVSREEALGSSHNKANRFGKVVLNWAKDRDGYLEQTFSYDN